MALSVARVKSVKATGKPFRIYDERGLYLQVTATGRRYWRLKYRLAGRQKVLALGVYPEVSMAAAREARDAARAQVREGIDPVAARQARRAHDATDTFAAVADEYLATRLDWKPGTAAVRRQRLERGVFPLIGKMPANAVTAPAVLRVLRQIEARGHHEVARRTLQLVSQVMAYAVRTGRAERNPAADLRGALTATQVRHHASVTDPRQVGALLRAIDGYAGSFVVACALRLAPLVFVRPGELRKAVWSEFDLAAAEWRIPAERMKVDAPHLVPLSSQAVTILDGLQTLTGPAGFVFPSMRGRGRPMSENTINAALRRLGYGTDEATGHGFRSMASTLLNEQGWHRDAIERQLAHAPRDKVRAAYNYAEHLPERRRMMQSWADYLDELRADTRMTTRAEACRTRAT